MSKDLELAIQAARKAGQLIREKYKTVHQISKKGISDFVTEIDVQAEKIILEILQSTGYSFLGEESGMKDNKSRKKWVIDPLDGTTNFIREFSFFAVSIALIEDDKNLVLGVVYDPIADECYFAERGQGAFLNGKKISMSQEVDFQDAILLFEHGRSEKSKQEYVQAFQKLLLNRGTGILRQGSTALMLCYLAKGSAEAFLSCGDALYDYAAGLIIAEEAGATISDWNGKTWDNSSSYILASNSPLQDEILLRIKGIQAENK